MSLNNPKRLVVLLLIALFVVFKMHQAKTHVVEPLAVPGQDACPAPKERPPLEARIVKDCEFGPCRFRSIREYQRDVKRMAQRVEFAERER